MKKTLGLEREILKELKREEDMDEDLLFGSSIGATLKTFIPKKKALAKMRIQQVLYEIQFDVIDNQ